MARLVIRRSTLAAVAFAATSFALAAVVLGTFPAPDDGSPRLAETGATVGLFALVAVVLLLVAGMILIVIGRRRSRRDD